MLTVSGLIEMAARYETMNDHFAAKQAMTVALHMEDMGLTGAKAVGPFSSVDLPKRGQKVRIKKGTLIKNIYRGNYKAARDYTVTIHDTYKGYINDVLSGSPTVHNPEVLWAGTGGYWSYVDLNDVEVLH